MFWRAFFTAFQDWFFRDLRAWLLPPFPLLRIRADAQTRPDSRTTDRDEALAMVDREVAHAATRLAAPLPEPLGLDLTVVEAEETQCRHQALAAADAADAALFAFCSGWSAQGMARLALEAAARAAAREDGDLADRLSEEDYDADRGFDALHFF